MQAAEAEGKRHAKGEDPALNRKKSNVGPDASRAPGAGEEEEARKPKAIRGAVSVAGPIPLLDASNLPSADDWALLEAIQMDADLAGDVEADFDRYVRLRGGR